MSARAIYLDNAATTPVDPSVVAAMLGFLGPDGDYANAASDTHGPGHAAAAAVALAREEVAALVGAEPREIVWTSGATESDNLAIKGAAEFHRERGRHIVTVRTEHKAVVDSCRELERHGFQVTFLKPDPDGLVDPAAVREALRPDTVLVSVMYVNNEIGVIQDIAAIGGVCSERGILFHVDAAQAAGRLPIDLTTLPVDLMSLSAHKFYGPKGVGALYVRRRPRARLHAQIHGGGHERGLRSGTLPTHQIVGMGEACRIVSREREAEQARIRELRDALWDGLCDLPGVHLNGHRTRRVAGILNVSVEGVDGEALMAALTLSLTAGDMPLAVSSGSACTSASREPSYVLRALGRSDALAEASVRFSPGRFTRRDDIDTAIARTRMAIRRLRALSPLWLAGQARREVAGDGV